MNKRRLKEFWKRVFYTELRVGNKVIILGTQYKSPELQIGRTAIIVEKTRDAYLVRTGRFNGIWFRKEWLKRA